MSTALVLIEAAAWACTQEMMVSILGRAGYRGPPFRRSDRPGLSIKVVASQSRPGSGIAFENPDGGGKGRTLDGPQLAAEVLGIEYVEASHLILSMAESRGDAGDHLEASVATGLKPSARLLRLADSMSMAGVPVDVGLTIEHQCALDAESMTLRASLARRLHVQAATVLHPIERRRGERLAPEEVERLDKTEADARALRRALGAAKGPRIFTEWRPSHARTGRWTDSVGFQSLSRALRPLVRAPPGRVLVHGDLGAADPVVAGAVSGDPHLLTAVTADLHIETARALFKMTEITPEQRAAAKVVGMKMLYNASTESLADSLAPWDLQECAHDFASDWLFLCKRYDKWRRRLFRRGRRGRAMRTAVGRRPIPFARSDLTHEGQSASWVIQGTVAAIFDRMLVELRRRLRNIPSAAIIAMIHDAVLVECDETDSVEVKRMVEAVLSAPVRVRNETVSFRVEASISTRWK